MRNLQYVAFLIFAAFLGGWSLQITNISVPTFVMNGTEESVVLDCEYEYTEEDKLKLVVKWFHNDDPIAVYQWITEHNTVEFSEKFGNRINTNYEISAGNKFTKRRALNILRPTTELSGKYSCQLTSLAGIDSESATMMVYAHPSDFYLNYSVSNDMVHVMCVVEGVYPIPEISMYHIYPGSVDRNPVEEVTLSYELDDDAYDVILSTDFSEDDFSDEGQTYFGCNVTMPGANYHETRELPFLKVAKAEMVGAEDSNDNGAWSLSAMFLLISSIALWQLFLTC